MTDPRRLVDAASSDLEALATLVRSVPAEDALSRAEILTQLDAAQTRVSSRSRRVRETAVFLASAAVAAFIVASLIPTRQIAFTVEPGAATTVTQGGTSIHLTRGVLRGVPAEKPVRLLTPHSWVEWTDARFRVAVDTAGTKLFVEQGEVLWRTPNGERHVGQGESARSPEPVVVPAALQEMAAPPPSQCTQADSSARAACLREMARGDGLKAQNALFEWALLQRELDAPEKAVEGWREYSSRFPEGALAPEASVALIADLILLDRYDEALVATRRHREMFPQVFPNEVAGLEAKLADAASKGRQ